MPFWAWTKAAMEAEPEKLARANELAVMDASDDDSVDRDEFEYRYEPYGNQHLIRDGLGHVRVRVYDSTESPLTARELSATITAYLNQAVEKGTLKP